MSERLETVVARERAAVEPRHWVRLTRACNSRCVFCHDAGRHDGSILPVDALEAEIRRGRAVGASRLVLSGGEPTLHPRLFELMRVAREVGYEWIQIITNGRMFAYEAFTRRAVEAGLDEATVSVHGHTPELHDALAGVRGAFGQAIQGIRNLRAAHRVVSVDVVVTRVNVGSLSDILDRFVTLGIHEFDLLFLIPFGRAYDQNRDRLFLDARTEQPRILAALAAATSRPGIQVWTNRWPAPLLEGLEHLIQDPHKILDEVRGTADAFDAFLRDGAYLECRGARCAHCFTEPFCRDLFRARERLVTGAFDLVAWDVRAAATLSSGARDAVARQVASAYRVSAPRTEDAVRAVHELPRGASALLELDVERLGPVPPEVGHRLQRVVVRDATSLVSALAFPSAPVLEIPLERSTIALARRAIAAAPGRVRLTVGGRDRLSDVLARDLHPDDLDATTRAIPCEGAPPCRGGAGPARNALWVDTLRADGKIDLLRWAERWVRDHFQVRSWRCDACAEASRCDGAHVNYVRAYGFGWMSPMAPRAD